ncbi:MAG: erythromycin esterase family protein [Mariniphaga sp.]
MNYRYLTIFGLLIFSLYGFGQQPVDKYNLDFEGPPRENVWLCILDNFRLNYDSIHKVKGVRSLLLTSPYQNGECNLSLSQFILLPKPAKTIKASIVARNKMLFSAGLKISGLDNNRNLLACDSVTLIKNNSWENFEVSITSDKAIEILLVEITAEEPSKEKKSRVKLWIDNLQIALDGIDLYSCKRLDYEYFMAGIGDIKENQPLTEQLELPEKVLDGIGSRIIGFGESAHGSNEIAKSVFNNIEQLIVNHNCRLVLLELPIDLGIRMNQYINGEILEEDLKRLVYKCHFDNNGLCSFLRWLKQYNSTNQEKVALFGFDDYLDDIPFHINYFLLGKKPKSATIDTLVGMINFQTSRSLPLKFAEKNVDELTALFGEKGYKTFIHYLKIRTDSLYRIVPLSKSYVSNGINRDYLLWQNTKFAIDNLSDGKSKIAVYSHLSHLNKKVPIFFNSVKSLGGYIADQYGDNYFLIGMIIGDGKVSTLASSNKMVAQEIGFPILRSIEFLSVQARTGNFYKPLPILSTVPILYRVIGSYYCEAREFEPSFTDKSMDAILFIRQSTPATIYNF